MREEVVNFFGLKPTQVRVIQHYVGGGFGGKGAAINEELIAALLALKSNQTVKHVFTRDEVFLHGGNRAPMIIYIKDGVKRNGNLIAREMKVILNAIDYADRDPDLDFRTDPQIVISGADELERMDQERDKLGRPRR